MAPLQIKRQEEKAMREYLEAGKIVSTHGVRGEMKMEVWGDDVSQIKKCGKVYFSAQGGASRKVLGIRPQGRMGLLTLEGVEDMDAARAMAGRVVYIARADLKLPKGHYFLQDLIGCRVEDAETGRVYGVVEDVTHPGAQDLYHVKDSTGKICYMPGVPAFVKQRLPEEGRILVTPIPGIFDEAEKIEEVPGQ